MKPIVVLSSEREPIAQSFRSIGGAVELFVQGRDFDIRNTDTIRDIIVKNKYRALVNAVEYYDIDTAEYNRGDVYEINSLSVKSLALLCQKNGIFFTHISSSYVFDGEGTKPFLEVDTPKPISAYGDSKLLGEKAIQETCTNYCIVRVTDTYGNGRDCFHLPFIKRNGKNDLEVIQGSSVSPINSNDVANAIIELIDSGAQGIYHLCCEGYVSPAAFIHKALSIINNRSHMNFSLSVKEVDAKEFLSPGDRPIFNVLDSANYRSLIKRPMRQWEEALSNHIVINLDTILSSFSL